MSNSVFPSLAGLTWDIKTIPSYEGGNQVQTVTSGKEKRLTNWTYPVWLFSLQYSFLKDDLTSTGDLQKLVKFFLDRHGDFDDWLYQHPDYNTVTNQLIGTGDGVVTQFQLIRSFGGFLEPVKGIVPSGGNPAIKVDGSTNTDFTCDNYGLVTFNNPPTGAITASFTYYYRCRFTLSKLDLNQFVQRLYELKKCDFKTLK